MNCGVGGTALHFVVAAFPKAGKKMKLTFLLSVPVLFVFMELNDL